MPTQPAQMQDLHRSCSAGQRRGHLRVESRHHGVQARAQPEVVCGLRFLSDGVLRRPQDCLLQAVCQSPLIGPTVLPSCETFAMPKAFGVLIGTAARIRARPWRHADSAAHHSSRWPQGTHLGVYFGALNVALLNGTLHFESLRLLILFCFFASPLQNFGARIEAQAGIATASCHKQGMQ